MPAASAGRRDCRQLTRMLQGEGKVPAGRCRGDLRRREPKREDTRSREIGQALGKRVDTEMTSPLAYGRQAVYNKAAMNTESASAASVNGGADPVSGGALAAHWATTSTSVLAAAVGQRQRE